MMKSFLKKLAFVMALAMVVTATAPAAGVFAAEAGVADENKTIVTEFALAVGESHDFSFQGCDNWAEAKATGDWGWTSDKEEVATVNYKGIVTGVADGVATITIKVGSDYEHSVVVTVGEGEKAEEADKTFTVAQKSDSKVELTFADTTITKSALAAGLETYFLINGVEVEYPVFYVDSVEDGVAVVKSYVLFTDGITYGFRYGEENAEFTATIGDVAYVTAMYKSAGKNYAAYVGKDTQVIATLWNAQGIDITKSAKGTVTYSLVAESTNGDYWPSGTEGYFYFNTAGASATVKVTYMTGEYDEMYNPVAGPDTKITLVSENMPKYDINSSVAPVATITTGNPDWDNASTVIALHDDNGAHKLVVKMKDNRGNYVNTKTGVSEGTFTFKSTNDAVLYVAADGTVMTNKEGEVSVLVYLTLNEQNATPKVVAVVPVSVKAERTATSLEVSQPAAVVSTVAGYNTATFTFTLKDQLKSKIDGGVVVTCNNANNLPTGAKAAPHIGTVTRTEKGVYSVVITGIEDNLPTNANGYTYTFTVKVNNWLTRTFNVTIRKPVLNAEATETAVSGYKLEFTNTNDIKTLAATASAFNNTATLYQLSNNVKFATADLKVKPASINDMKVGEFYYTISKDGSLITDIDGTNSLVKTEDGKVVINLTKFEEITGVNNALNGSLLVKKDKLGAGNYTIVVYKGLGTGTTGVATASTFTQVTSNTLTVTDSQDTMSYAGRNGQNEVVAGTTLETIVKTKFKFKIGNTTLDGENDYVDNKIQVVVDANTVTNGKVVYINKVDFYKQVGVDENSTPVYVKYTVNVGDYVNVK